MPPRATTRKGLTKLLVSSLLSSFFLFQFDKDNRLAKQAVIKSEKLGAQMGPLPLFGGGSQKLNWGIHGNSVL